MRLIHVLIEGCVISMSIAKHRKMRRSHRAREFDLTVLQGSRGPSSRRNRVSAGAELTFLLIAALLRSLVHVPHVPDENILAARLVFAEIAEKLGRRAAYGAQMTLETRLPRVPLSAFRAYVRLAHVFSERVGLLRGRTYKLDARILERSFS